MRLPILKFFLFTGLLISLSSCVRRGNYTIAGTFDKVTVPASNIKIGVLDPRGYFGDDQSLQTQFDALKQLRKCDGAQLISEDQLRWASIPPPPYGASLTIDNINYLMDNTDLDYVVWTELGPGQSEAVSGRGFAIQSDLEAYAFLILYDLNSGEQVKSITVNGRLDYGEDSPWWEVYYDEDDMARRALRKALKRMVEYVECG